MRLLFSILSVAATGYLAYVTSAEFRTAGASSTPAPAIVLAEAAPAPALAEATPPAPEPAPAAEPEAPAPIAIAPAPAPAAPTVRVAPDGSFFLTKRVSVENNSGIIAILPGELVTLAYRNKDGTAKVKWSGYSVTVPEAHLAREYDPAAKTPVVSAQLFGQRTAPPSAIRRD